MASTFSDYTFAQPDLPSTVERYADFHRRLEVADGPDTCLSLLKDWDQVLCEFKEWSTLTYIRYHQDTQNEAAILEKKRLDEVLPKFVELETRLKQAFLESKWLEAVTEQTGCQLFAKWACQTRSYSPEIEDELAYELKLQSEYTALTAGGTVAFRGETYTLSELGQFYDDADRQLREASYRANSDWHACQSTALDRIYDEQVKTRHRMATKLGYRNFTELAYQRMTRIGYGPEEVEIFRNEVRDQVVPLAQEVAGQQAERLGIPLKFWDSTVYSSEGNPRPLCDHDWMIERASEMFEEMGHGLPEFFEEMKARDLMDLKSRPGKAGGGFCDYLPQFGFPFIFANFNGTRGDVDVFTHEMGHAFQSYSSRQQVLSDLIWPTSEACEIHSMGLEFLTWPHMDKFYGTPAAEELRRIHLTQYLHFLPYGVAIDHFQHLVYARPEASPKERNQMWQEVEAIYLPWHDYSDLPHESSGRLWQQKQHLYMCPFYYIDYCLALTGALQFWAKSRTEPEGALQAYATLCKLGGSQSYTGLLDSADLQSPFTKGCLSDVIADAKQFLAS